MAKRIPVLYGTESGNAEYCAELLARAITEAGFRSEPIDMDHFEPVDIVNETLVFIVTSTHGYGDAPSNAAALLEYLQVTELNLGAMKFAVCGLGDTAFDLFAQCGKDFDAVLEQRGATRVLERVDCDDDYDDAFEGFQKGVVQYLNGRKSELADWSTAA